MDIFSTIKGRRSCRAFLPEPIPQEMIATILEAAVWAPSPMNAQPWDFIVITNQETKKTIFAETEKLKQDLFQKSAWKWLGRYNVDFLLSAPVLVVVVGDPDKTGADKFKKAAVLHTSTPVQRRFRTCFLRPMLSDLEVCGSLCLTQK